MANEDLTVYDEIDSSGYITVAANLITATDLESDVQASVGDDINAREGVQYGVGFGGFTWTVTVNAAPGATGTGGKFFCPLVGPAHEDGGAQKTGGSGWNLKWDKFDGTKTPALGVAGGGTKVNLSGTATQEGTDYFLKFIFDDTADTITAEIYLEASHTTLDSSASLAIGGDTGPFDWVMVAANEDRGAIGNKDITGTVTDFDLGFASGADVTFSGTATVTGSTTGALSVDVALAGSALVSGSTTGVLSKDVPFTGTATISGSTTGVLTRERSLSGTSSISGTTTGNITRDRLFTGTSTITGSTVGVLTLQGTVFFAGTSTVAASTTGVVTRDRGLSGTCNITGTTTGVLTVTSPSGSDVTFSGTSTIPGSTAGVLSVDVSFAGTPTIAGSTAGVLSVDVSFSGTATITGSYTGNLSLDKMLSGTSTVTGSTAGALTRDRLLGGTANITGSTTGAISVDLAFGGTSTNTGSSSGVITMDRGFGGEVIVTGSTSGVLTVLSAGPYVNFSGTANIQGTTFGRLSLALPHPVWVGKLAGIDYTVDQETGEVKFATPPPTGVDNIEICRVTRRGDLEEPAGLSPEELSEQAYMLATEVEDQLVGAPMVFQARDWGLGVTSVDPTYGGQPLSTIHMPVLERMTLRQVACSFIHDHGLDPGDWTLRIRKNGGTADLATFTVTFSATPLLNQVTQGEWSTPVDLDPGDTFHLLLDGPSVDQISGNIFLGSKVRTPLTT